VPRRQTPFRLQGEVVDPFDNGRELVEPVLHRRAGEDEAVPWSQALHGERGLRRPVLDPLGLVQHDDVRVPVVDDVHVPEELFVVRHQEPTAARIEGGPTLDGSPFHDRGGSVREELPLANPLRLERRRNDQQATADAAGAPQGVAGGNRLRGLAEPHVIGEEERPPHEEPLDGLALIRIEGLLEAPQRVAHALDGARVLGLACEPPAIFEEQRVQRRLAVAVLERAEQSIHQRQPLLARIGNLHDPAARLRRGCGAQASVRWVQPASQIAVRCAVHPANARQPVAGARQRADRVPAQRLDGRD
jgi:hypothetical protein